MRDESGRRIRKFFASRDEASEWLSQFRPELKNQGRAALALTDRQRTDAVRALEILRPYGKSLTEAAQALAEKTRALERSVPFKELREEMVSAKRTDRLSSRYVSDLVSRLKKFGQDFDTRQVALIETKEVEDWLRSLNLSAGSRINFQKVLRTAFEFAVARGYSKSNPVALTSKIRHEPFSPGILKPREIAALLGESPIEIIPWVTLAAFAGLRDAEIGRMTWDRVDLVGGHIKVDASIAKTSSRRLVPISENLREWLQPHFKESGCVRGNPSTVYPLLRETRKRAIAVLRKSKVDTLNLEGWPHNAFRHSFASYRLALVANAAQVAEECGHSVEIMKKHYRELVTKAEAEAWFAITPSAASEEVVGFVKAAESNPARLIAKTLRRNPLPRSKNRAIHK